MKLTVIIPVFNEIQTIGKIVEDVLASEYDKEVIIIEDGSSDGTREFLRESQRAFAGVKVVFHEGNKGKTAAIRTALPYVTGDIVVIQDADLEYSPGDYHDLVEPIRAGKADAVYGSRFSHVNRHLFAWHWLQSRILQRPYEIRHLSHFLGTQFLNAVVFLLYGMRIGDVATGLKAFRAPLIKSMKLRTDRFEFCYEITAKLLKSKAMLIERSIGYHPRSSTEGKKITWMDGVWATLALLRFRFGN
jgi:glycosyltransferase involved in cell wall biosynthesis